jgi:hypothetical protein
MQNGSILPLWQKKKKKKDSINQELQKPIVKVDSKVAI